MITYCEKFLKLQYIYFGVFEQNSLQKFQNFLKFVKNEIKLGIFQAMEHGFPVYKPEKINNFNIPKNRDF